MEEREMQARDPGSRAFRRARWLPIVAVTAVVGVTVPAAPAGSSKAAGNWFTADAMVQARDNAFAPQTVTINQGETVFWTNVGSNPHNVKFADESVARPAPASASAWTVSRTFNTPGTFSYVCEVHATMTGTVNVNAVAPAPGPPPPGTPTPPAPGPPAPGPPTPGDPAPNTPGGGEKSATTVSLRLSDATPSRGQRVRFFGSVKPERDGRVVQLQRRRRGSFRTVERIRLRDAGASRSTYSKRLRVLSDAVFRARLASDADHEAGTSRSRRVDVR
jgi:plastocyanin